MILPALPDLTTPQDELTSVKERLLAVKASLEKACQELDAQIQELDLLAETGILPQIPAKPGLFESEPVPPVSISKLLPTVPSAPAPKPQPEAPITSIVLSATAPTVLDPDLEQATLEELNSALSQAFAEISGRYPWAQ